MVRLVILVVITILIRIFSSDERRVCSSALKVHCCADVIEFRRCRHCDFIPIVVEENAVRICSLRECAVISG